jgi:hypothetical protein
MCRYMHVNLDKSKSQIICAYGELGFQIKSDNKSIAEPLFKLGAWREMCVLLFQATSFNYIWYLHTKKKMVIRIRLTSQLTVQPISATCVCPSSSLVSKHCAAFPLFFLPYQFWMLNRKRVTEFVVFLQPFDHNITTCTHIPVMLSSDQMTFLLKQIILLHLAYMLAWSIYHW